MTLSTSETEVPNGMEDTVLRFPLELELATDGVILKGVVEEDKDEDDELVSSLPSLSSPNTDTRSRKVSSSQSPALEPEKSWKRSFAWHHNLQ